MTNICSIIAEYNPFHSGHRYQLKKAKEISDADYIAVILSSDFVQRGEPAIFSKYIRAEMAIKAGADIVLELPVQFSCSYAENFAFGGVSIANKIGSEYLAFGSETEDLSLLYKNTETKPDLKNALSSGISYAKAYSDSTDFELLPNDILGTEYIRAIKKLNSNIKPVAIKRINSMHDHIEENNEREYYSALSVREAIKSGKITAESLGISEKAVFTEDLFITLLYQLRKMSISELSEISEVTEGLEYKIKEASKTAASFDELIFGIKSKRYTMAKIKRILMKCLIGITKTDDAFIDYDNIPVHVLGIKKESRSLLSEISKCCEIITNPVGTDNLIMQKSILATDIYSVFGKNPSGRDFSKHLIK